MNIKHLLLVLALAASSLAGAQQPPVQQQDPAQAPAQVQDGIAVRPLSRFRVLAPEATVEQQSKQQYTGLISKAEQSGALLPDHHPQVLRLRAIAKRMVPYATRWNPAAANWNWQVNLLASKEVNAFCMPGGRIAFYTGLVDKLKLTDDEVAAIMGHEVAHALREHGRDQMVKSVGTSLGLRLGSAVLSSWLGIDPRITDTAAHYGSQLLSLRYSRDDEREADLVGLDLAARAGFDPRAGVAVWQKMGAVSKGTPIALLSTHPGGPERITQIQNHMNLLLPVYARAKGIKTERLPAYKTNVL
jgi:Zn-dependent protease with chaperone function